LLAFVIFAATAGTGGCANGDSTATGDDDGSVGDDATIEAAAEAAPPKCTAPRTQCGTACVSTTNDPKNCGKCGVVCGMNQVCDMGVCNYQCTPPATLCGQMSSDGGNEGGPAPADASAKETGASEAGAADAGDAGADAGGAMPYCANLGSDNGNCGQCGKQCKPMHTCMMGECGLTCAPGQRACIAGDVCIPDATCCSSADCMIIGEVCPAPGGQCQCPSGEKICAKSNSCITENDCCTQADCTVAGSTCPAPGQPCQCTNGQKACPASNSCIPQNDCCTGIDCTKPPLGPEPNVQTYSCNNGMCGILTCNHGCFDLDKNYNNGCECCDDPLGKACPTPTGIGQINLGQTVNQQGQLPAGGAESDWLQVTFSNEGNKAFHAHVWFTSNPNNEFAFDIQSDCNQPPTLLGCGEGGNCAGRVEWEVQYTAGDPGSPGWGPIAPIGTVYIRVYRVNGAANCDQWALAISE
jgi:hypothetical protein